MSTAVLLCLTGCLAAAAVAAQASQTGAGNMKAGALLFRTYCASCHGVAGRGDGPLVQELRKAPPDLTQYTARNRGVFPKELLRRIIEGAEIAAHGNREMPVWGDGFKSAREGLTPEAARARIEAIVGYLEAIQQQAAE